ncbi:hypothetical protein Tco_0586867 [Tanacetum coccineum]
MHPDRLRGQQRKKLRCVKVGLPFTVRMESGARDEDYVQRAMIHYEIDTGIPFKLLSGRGVTRGTQGTLVLVRSPTEYGEQSINLNTIVGDTDEDEVQEIRLEGRDKVQPYDHLTGDQRKAMDEIRAKIKAKYNLQY